MKSESEVQQLIQLEARHKECHLMRNNSGALKDDTGRMVRYGLGNVSKKQNEAFKSSDLIGIREMVITPEMVGNTVGVFTAIEVKGEDWKFKGTDREVAQHRFMKWVIDRGGIAGFAKSVQEFNQILKNY